MLPKSLLVTRYWLLDWIGNALFDALRQNRTQKISYGRSFCFCAKAQKQNERPKIFFGTRF
jgi:hypothetical protein